MTPLLQDSKDGINIYYIKELQLELINLAQLFNNGEITPYEIINKLWAEIECVLENEHSILEEIKRLGKERDNRIIELKEKYDGKELTELEKKFYPRCLDHLFEGELEVLENLKKELEQYRENLQDVFYKTSVASENPEYWKMRRDKMGNNGEALDKQPDMVARESGTMTEDLPKNRFLQRLAEGNDPVLRDWHGGKYKCSSLEIFIKKYIKLADNLTPSLIRDYLISERTEKPYTPKTIETNLKLYGPGRK
jgi:hypothetical protein